ncbi:MAG TPA: hypothetical protein VK019_02045, partial [Pseudomonas sp.]|nr:hypothetical protein [Pseudomonas sp.]
MNTPSSTESVKPSSSESVKSNLGEATSHLKQAAHDAGDAVRGAASAASEELKLGRANVKGDLADSALSGLGAI